MFESVINVKHIKDYKVWIVFDNGKKGEIDLEKKSKIVVEFLSCYRI